MRAQLACAVIGLGVAACGGDDDDPAAIDAGSDGVIAAPLLVERFDGAGAWPGWTVLGGVDDATVDVNRGALAPVISGYSLGRMGHALPAGAVDVEVRFALAMTDPATQGVGFYVRQNGGYLQASQPRGAGYAVFVESFAGAKLGVWRERDGIEEVVARVDLATISAGTIYEVRFRCAQDGARTALSASLWPRGDAEPAGWTVTGTDDVPALQGAAGAIAVDAWNNRTTGAAAPPIYVDDIEVRGL